MKEASEKVAKLFEEFESEEENVARKLKLVEDFQNNSKKLYDQELLNTKETYEKERAAAAGNNQELLAIDEAYLRDKESLEKGYLAQIEGARVVANQKMIEGLKAAYDAAGKAIKTQLTDLKSELKGLESDLEKTLDAMKSAEESFHDGLRSLRQKSMTDEKRWLDDRKEANRLLNEAVETGDAETAKKAMELFKALAREVKNETGETVKGIKETTRIATEGFTAAHNVLVELLKAQATETRNQIKETEDSIDSLNTKLEKYKELLTGLATAKITLSVAGAIAGLDKAIKQVNDIKNKVGAAKDPIIMEIRTDGAVTSIKQVKKSLDEVQEELKQIAGGLYVVEFRGKGSTTTGLVEKLNEIGNRTASILRLFQETAKTWVSTLKINIVGLSALEKAKRLYDGFKSKTVTLTINTSGGGGGGKNTEEFAGGGSVPGTGTGDKVPAMLEPTEFVIRKEAVLKYGAGLFDRYNKMLVNVGAGFRRGGVVAVPQKTPKPMQAGGPAAATAAFGGGGDTFHFTLSPMVMTGDRRSLEQAAIIFMKEFKNLKLRGY